MLHLIHDLIIALAFLAIVVAPAVLASRSNTSEGT
jgi:hypothetical protein